MNHSEVFNIDKDRVYRKTVAIVFTKWNQKWVLEMVRKINSKLDEYDIKVYFKEVPSAYEIPLICQRLNKGMSCLEAIITVGVILKGETIHFESVYKGIIDVQLKNDIPIINGVITSTEQEVENTVNSSLPEYLALSALHMLQ